MLAGRREEIESGELVVFMADECHLLWGDVNGYVWGKTRERVSVPVSNARCQQTYFGALDYKTKEFFIYKAKKANSETTIGFLEYLQFISPQAKILIIWDGASYHRSGQIKEYLDSLNAELEKEQWLITCERFAPNAPQQNPLRRYLVTSKKTDSRILLFLSFFLCTQGVI